tara:strand:- start:197 stop:823 length:627 start_codon:yes stop_codon:yes gene_type:complete
MQEDDMEDDVIEIENIIGKTYQKTLLDRVTEKQFPWYLNKHQVSSDMFTKDNDINPVGWNHFLFEEQKIISPIFDLFHPLVMTIQDLNLFPNASLERMRLNLNEMARDNPHEHHLPHIDSWYDHWNVIYYLNDSSGETYIFNETNKEYDTNDQEYVRNTKFTVKKKITPKQGKIVAFPGHYYHSSSPNRNSPYRILCNINFAGFDHVM